MRVYNNIILSGTTVTGTNVSPAQPLDHIYGFSVQLVHPLASASGVFSLEASNDASNWTTVSSVNINTSGSTILNTTDAFYKNVRGRLVVNSGTFSSFTANMYTKGV